MVKQHQSQIRAMRADDVGVVVGPWVGCHWSANRWLPRNEHLRWCGQAVKETLTRASVWVACSPDDPCRVLGWLCGDTVNGVLHFAWVREEARRKGLFRQMLACLFASTKRPDFSGWSAEWARVYPRLAGQLGRYRPELFRGPKPIGDRNVQGVRDQAQGCQDHLAAR
jgi:hypothetical protein